MKRFPEKRLVIASHNAGKIDEIIALLAPLGFEVVSAGSLGLDDPEETEETFAGNARIKAHYVAKSSGYPAISDDSGLVVDALDGKPGVHTAGWAQTSIGRDFHMAMTRVWNELEIRKAPEPRSARFVCTLCLAWPDGSDLVFEGSVEGRLIWPFRGNRGFGFDPMFLPDGKSLTFGEMEPADKHVMSHRAVAFQKFLKWLGDV